MDYLYDDSFEGLLTCIYYHYYEEKATGIYSKAKYQVNILQEYKIIATNLEKAQKVSYGIKAKISYEGHRQITNVFLSEEPNKENIILTYLIYAFKEGPKGEQNYTHPAVYPLYKISKKVSFEAHRFKGLIRFIEVGELLYAQIEPDNNILPLIAPHFKNRYKNENFLIHDKKRKKAIAYNKKECVITDFEQESDVPITEKEEKFQALWQKYFETISIENKKNPLLQQQFVPLKYRKNILEFKRGTINREIDKEK
ncbi:putative DNA metabolism protein [Natranaerovirga hydrolytica]|uniref:Putative DNA metabolism protein n=1 Tax=Natranaerovirga hydrolytica TaxID=680378 RepID=A0A4R1NA63_9FIRM|nr:TIGR03915 family putative DNA repair protein [Natranaerovirga hydrolytica]TCL00055.1 putative DNA metabolism protein [Natranaerovirga hydrolytica]